MPLTSYSFPPGSQYRLGLVAITHSGIFNGNPSALLNGNYGDNDPWFTGAAAAGAWITFDFGRAHVIDEAKWYQSNTASHGVWQWQGSPDNSTWTDIGASFTLGGAATQTQTTLNGNTAFYRYYRLLGVSGSLSTSPWLFEIDFQISVADGQDEDTLYSNAGGSGDRTATVTATQSTGLFEGGDPPSLINGSYTAGAFFWNSTVSGKYLQWQFSSPRIITEAVWYQDIAREHGVWKWRGSSDGSTWADIGASFTLGHLTSPVTALTALNANTAVYSYYRLEGVSGSSTRDPWIYEVRFKIGESAAEPTAIRQTQQALEVVQEPPLAELRATQGALEVVQEPPPSSAVRATQGALENLYVRPNTVWATQVCLEVLFPAYTPPAPASRRNHSFYGSMWQSTGHGFNSSFND